MNDTENTQDMDRQEFPILSHELGRRLSSKEVADYMGLDEDTVRKYYEDSVEFVQWVRKAGSCSLKKTS